MNNEKEKIKSFTDLDAWKEGHLLVLSVYHMTRDFPKEEMLGLTSQMRRCAVSVTSNVAKGFARQSYKEKVQFYSIAQGSVTELQNQLYIAKDVEYINRTIFDDTYKHSVKVHKIISGLMKGARLFTSIPNS